MSENNNKSEKSKVRGIDISVFQEEASIGRQTHTKSEDKTSKKIDNVAEKKNTNKKKKPVSKKEVTKKKTETVSEKVLTEKKTEIIPEKEVAQKTDDTQKKNEFETLKIDVSETKKDSKIIVRDVARIIPVIEKQSVESLKPSSKKTESPAIELPKPATIIQQAPRAQAQPKLSAKEIKEREIKRAINTATKLPGNSKTRKQKSMLKRFGVARIALATACMATAVFAIVYFVNLTSKDMSMQVAAVQSGIEASYPSYIPRGFDLSDVTSSKGKITMNFKSEDGTYTISQESSNWDSDGLLDNYIKEQYDDDEYTILREQGLTIYMGTNWEAWINGGILYKLNITSGTLTKKQMKTIATSF